MSVLVIGILSFLFGGMFGVVLTCAIVASKGRDE